MPAIPAAEACPASDCFPGLQDPAVDLSAIAGWPFEFHLHESRSGLAMSRSGPGTLQYITRYRIANQVFSRLHANAANSPPRDEA